MLIRDFEGRQPTVGVKPVFLPSYTPSGTFRNVSVYLRETDTGRQEDIKSGGRCKCNGGYRSYRNGNEFVCIHLQFHDCWLSSLTRERNGFLQTLYLYFWYARRLPKFINSEDEYGKMGSLIRVGRRPTAPTTSRSRIWEAPPPTRGNLGGSGTRQPANHRVDRKTRPRHLKLS